MFPEPLDLSQECAGTIAAPRLDHLPPGLPSIAFPGSFLRAEKSTKTRPLFLKKMGQTRICTVACEDLALGGELAVNIFFPKGRNNEGYFRILVFPFTHKETKNPGMVICACNPRTSGDQKTSDPWGSVANSQASLESSSK